MAALEWSQFPPRSLYVTLLASGLLLQDLPFNFPADLVRGEIPCRLRPPCSPFSER